jgi:7-keto-8-aminopelargonate synthetase-like enzyme
MLLAGVQASRGDDVYHDDAATTALEDRIAKLTGKEAGLFVVSGTMSNRELKAVLVYMGLLARLNFHHMIQNWQSVRHWRNHHIA